LEATPAEGTTYTFARADKKAFGDRIKVANESSVKSQGAAPYYTNSTQLPVDFGEDVFEALDLQDEIQCKYTGGTVFHAYVGEKLDKQAVKTLVKKVTDKYHLPYFTISPIFSICPIHGYLSGEHEFCPICDKENGYKKEESESTKKIEVENETNKV